MQRVRARIRLTDEVRRELIVVRDKTSLPKIIVERANIILSAEKEQNNTAVAEALDITTHKVSNWTHRWKDTQNENMSIIERLSDTQRLGNPRLSQLSKCVS